MRKFRVSYLLGLLLILCALFPTALAPYAPRDMFLPFMPPCVEHLLGTDDMGYDLLSQLIFATRATLVTGLVSALCTLCLGAGFGLCAGYAQGFLGLALGGILQAFLVLPMLPMALLLASYLGAGTGSIILAIALLGWSGTARAVRAKVRQLRSAPFVASLRVLGASSTRILRCHLLPNVRDVLAAKCLLAVGQCMMTEASLRFIGLCDPARVTWGSMLRFAFARGGFARGLWLWYVPPGLCILLSVYLCYRYGRFLSQRAEIPMA